MKKFVIALLLLTVSLLELKSQQPPFFGEKDTILA